MEIVRRKFEKKMVYLEKGNISEEFENKKRPLAVGVMAFMRELRDHVFCAFIVSGTVIHFWTFLRDIRL
jgi:hypothetical protein